MKTAYAFVVMVALSGCGAPEEEMGSAASNITGAKADSASPDATSTAAKLETFAGSDGRYYFHLLAPNGEELLESQGYTTKESALTGIASVQKNGAAASNYDLLAAQNGAWYFNLVAQNHEIIATSMLYAANTDAATGIDTVMDALKVSTTGAAPTTATFQVFAGANGEYYFHLRAKNGEIVLASQAYTQKDSALDGTKSVALNGVDANNYQILDAANGQAYFVLVAANDEVIGVSQMYANRSDATRGVNDVATLLASGVISTQK